MKRQQARPAADGSGRSWIGTLVVAAFICAIAALETIVPAAVGVLVP